MKGLVFTEFLDFVEESFSLEVVDNIIEKSNIKSGGVYSKIGTYDHEEIVSLVVTLSDEVKMPIDDLIEAFGENLFTIFHDNFPQFFENVKDCFEFLSSIDQYIHVEVRKLYKDVELPKFEYEKPDNDTLILKYSSERPMAKLAEGLIKGCISYYKEDISLSVQMQKENEYKEANFILKK